MDPDATAILDAYNEESTAPVQEPVEQKTETAETPEVQAETNSEPAASSTPVAEATETGTPAPLTNEQPTEEVAQETDWRTSLPPQPIATNVPFPERDEDGNVDPAAYEDYILSKAEQRLEMKNYNMTVESRALDAAELILPEIKTNPQIRQMVEDIRVAQVVNGQSGDTVAAAQQIKALIGSAKALGAQNSKASIEVQRNATLETSGSSQPSASNVKGEKIADRINKGDDDAFIELLDIWQGEGYL